MASTTIKSTESAVMQELVRRCNDILGYPKIGIVANGAVQQGAGIFVPSDMIVTDCATEFSVSSADGTVYLLVTDTFRTTVQTVQSDAQTRINNMVPISFDTEIVALSEVAVEYGDNHQVVFNPRAIANCAAWMRADTGITITAGKVSGWKAYTQSGTATFGNAVAGNQPVQSSNVLNGRTAMTFDGNDWLENGFAALTQPMTLYVVADADDNTGIHTLVNTKDAKIKAVYNATSFDAYAGQTVSVTNVGTIPHIYEVIVNGSHSRIGVDAEGPNDVNLGANNGTGIVVGSDDTGANGHKGHIFEVIYFDRALNPTERKIVRNGLAKQYGMVVQ